MIELKDVSIQECEDRLNKNPKSFIFSRLADCYRKSGDIQQAIKVCSRGLADHPDSITGRVILGRCYLEQEKFKEASVEFLKVIEQDHRNQVAVKMLADIFTHQGMMEKAGDLYGFLMSMDPENQSIVNLSASYKGTGTSNIYRILGFGRPEQVGPAQSDLGKTSVEQPMPAQDEAPIQAESPFQESEEAFARTIQMDPAELKKEASRAESPFARTMQFDAEELNPALHDQDSGIEEVVADIPAGGGAVTGDDISARMSMMFTEEAPLAATGAGEVQAQQFDEGIISESPEAAAGMQPDSPVDPQSVPEVSGSDISNRIEQLFGESASSEEPAAAMQPGSGDYTQVFDLSSAVDQPVSGLTGAVTHEAPADADGQPQADLSGEDIVTRMSEMFETSGIETEPTSAPSVTEEIVEAALSDDDEKAVVTDAEETLASISETGEPIPESYEPQAAPDAAPLAKEPGPDRSEAVEGSVSKEMSEMFQEGTISGDDIARRLETIFEEDESFSSITPAQAPSVHESGPAISEEQEPSISDTISFENDAAAPEEAEAAEATVVQDVGNEDFSAFLDQMPLSVQPAEQPAQEAVTGGGADAMPVQPQNSLLQEQLDDALPAEEAPGMSGDDVRTRLDEIFPDALISEETLSMVDEIPEGEKDEERLNQGFYTMSGENAGEGVSDEKMLQQLDVAEIAAPDKGKGAQAYGEHAESDGKRALHDDFRETDTPDNFPMPPGQPADDHLSAIPDHVLTPTLADIYFQQGQPHLAVQIYSRLLQKDPENEKIAQRLEIIKKCIADNPQVPPIPAPPSIEKAAAPKPDKKPSSHKRSRKKAPAIPKPLAGVRIKKRKK
jgi:pilus assembly protein FimV